MLFATSDNAQSKDSKVTYVVDKSIISFAKFAVACLAVFMIMGTFAVGIDVKTLTKEMADSEKDMRDATDKIRNSEDSIRANEDKIRSLNEDISK